MKEKKYLVKMAIFRMTSEEVEAKNKKEAFQKAKDQSDYNDGATEFTLFEIEEIK